MKKIFLIIATIANVTQQSSAQNYNRETKVGTSPNSLQIGIKAGMNYSNVYNSNGESFNTTPKFGYVAGGFVSFPITQLLGLQFEALITQKGYQATGMLLGRSYDITRTTTYFAVPILLSFRCGKYVSILAGPQFAYLIKQKDSNANGSTSIEQENAFTNENIRKNILGFTFGFDFNLNHVVIGTRAGWDIQNNNGDGSTTTPKYNNAWFQATLGYRLFNY